MAPLKPHFLDAKAKLAHLVKHRRHAPLGTGSSSPAFIKRLCPDVIISSEKAMSLIRRDARLAF